MWDELFIGLLSRDPCAIYFERRCITGWCFNVDSVARFEWGRTRVHETRTRVLSVMSRLNYKPDIHAVKRRRGRVESL
jgi:hypothetical protein